MTVRTADTACSEPSTTASDGVDGLARIIFEEAHTDHAREMDDRLAQILGVQWILTIAVTAGAAFIQGLGPETWTAAAIGVVGGGLVTVGPLVLAKRRPGELSTRYVLAAAQLMWSSLLIYLTGGRIETHFHVFVSLILLGHYRDYRVFVPAGGVWLADHIVRTYVHPQSLYGTANGAVGTMLEHIGWGLGLIFLLVGQTISGYREMHKLAVRQAQLVRSEESLTEAAELLEDRVRERTAELEAARDALKDHIAEHERVKNELQMAQKLEAIGRLAAGVAHEINTPIQYVGDSIHFLGSAFEDLQRLLDRYQEVLCDIPTDTQQAPALERILEIHGDVDWAFIREEMPLSIERALDGVKRVSLIVRAMKEFAHPGSGSQSYADINKLIENTLLVAKNEYKYVAEVQTDYADLPPVLCYPGELNQVFINLVVNSAHAVEAAGKGMDNRGVIAIRTALVGDDVVIEVRDDGCGIAEEHLKMVFDPFFTTKEVGKGTGQGLSLARSAIVERHGGRIDVESTVGMGTLFTISIPVEGRRERSAA